MAQETNQTNKQTTKTDTREQSQNSAQSPKHRAKAFSAASISAPLPTTPSLTWYSLEDGRPEVPCKVEHHPATAPCTLFPGYRPSSIEEEPGGRYQAGHSGGRDPRRGTEQEECVEHCQLLISLPQYLRELRARVSQTHCSWGAKRRGLSKCWLQLGPEKEGVSPTAAQPVPGRDTHV